MRIREQGGKTVTQKSVAKPRHLLSLNNKRYDLAVFVGRFQPFHAGHLKVIREALEVAAEVIVYIGSDLTARRFDILPFTSQERERMIMDSLTEDERKRVIIRYMVDFHNNTLWISNLERMTNEVAQSIGYEKPSVTLVGYSKDQSSFYLKCFPNYDSTNVDPHEIEVEVITDILSPCKTTKRVVMSATDFREMYFSDRAQEVLQSDHLPEGTKTFLREFLSSPEYANLMEEKRDSLKYKDLWKNVPYPVIFQTVDNVVFHGSYVLLVQRKHSPGKGLWALPGGFLNYMEAIPDASIRELYEETKLSLPRAILEASIIGKPILFDDPMRSTRGRTITHATVYNVTPKSPARQQGENMHDYRKRVDAIMKLPKVKAADDAKKAQWVRLDEIKREEMFEDHWYIIETAKHAMGM